MGFLSLGAAPSFAGDAVVDCNLDRGFFAAGAAGNVYATTTWDDGSGPALYVGGVFRAVRDVPAKNVARWDGSTWQPVGGGFDGTVSHLETWNDGTGEALYAGGAFSQAGGVSTTNIARWNGTEWSPLVGASGEGLPGSVATMTIFDDGSGPALFVGGRFTLNSESARIVKWDGVDWSRIDTFSIGIVLALETWDDGTEEALYATGTFPEFARVARWDGTDWQALGTGLINSGSGHALVATQGPGSVLYLGGEFATAGGVIARGLARWDGSAWSGVVNTQGQGIVASAIDSAYFWDDGEGEALFVGGQITSVGPGIMTRGIARFGNGEWSALGGGFDSLEQRVYDMVGWDDGNGERLAVGGVFSSVGESFHASGVGAWDGTTWSRVASQTPVGQGMDAWSSVRSYTEWDDGTGTALYAGGSFQWAGGVLVNHIARWDGTSWTALAGPSGIGTDNTVHALAVFDDGSGEALWAAGEFILAGGIASRSLAKWDGTSWSAPASADALNGSAHALEIWDDGGGFGLIVGGNFRQAGSLEVNGVARWRGGAWERFGDAAEPGVNMRVLALKVWDDGTGEELYAGGSRRPGGGSGGVDVGRLAVWDGAAWSIPGGDSTALGSTDDVRSLEIWDDGSGAALYIGGDFDRIGPGNGQIANNIALWNGTDYSRPGFGSIAPVERLAVADEGAGPALYAGGRFDRMDGVVVNGLGRWDGQEWSAFDPVGFSGSFSGQGQFYSVAAIHGSNTPGIEGFYVGGAFQLAGGAPSSAMARWQCDLLPPEVFLDGFESGDTNAWTTSVGVN